MVSFMVMMILCVVVLVECIGEVFEFEFMFICLENGVIEFLVLGVVVFDDVEFIYFGVDFLVFSGISFVV